MAVKKIEIGKKMLMASIAIGVVLIIVPFLFYGSPLFARLIGGFVAAAVVIAVMPTLVYLYFRHYRVVAIEDQFPNFIRDLAESKNAGMTLPLALENSTTIDYGALNDDIRLMANQISWGVSLPEVLKRFNKRMKSSFIARAIAIILEAHKSGGNIADILQSVADDARMIKESEEQRRASMSEYMATVYTIFFVFLGILTALIKILEPLSAIPAVAGFGIRTTGGTYLFGIYFRILFFHLTMIQGFLNGILAGEIGQSSAVAGLKHSLIFMFIAFVVFLAFIYDFQIECMFAPTVNMFNAMGCIE